MKPADINHAAITASAGLGSLRDHVQGQLGGRVRDLQLVFLDRGIVLRGFARTYHAKQLAQHAVMTATHVPIMANEIEVS